MFTGTFMRSLIAKGVILTMAASTLAMANPRSTGEWFNGSVRLMGGAKLLEQFWEPANNHGQFGMLVDYLPIGAPVHLAVDVISTSATGNTGGSNCWWWDGRNWCSTSVTLSTSEFNAGFRKHIDMGGLRPYAGSGLGFVSTTRSFNNSSVPSDTNNTFSAWVNAGAAVMLHEYVNAGLDIRYNYSPIDVRNSSGQNVRRNVGGLGAGFFLGYQW